MESKKYNEYYYGKKVSRYGLENGKVDYACLREAIGDCVLCNNMEKRLYETMDIASDPDTLFKIEYTEEEFEENEELKEEYEDYYEYFENNKEMYDIFQWYIISDSGAQLLMRETDEIVFYDNELDVYVWGITHWGTSWDYVLTDIKLKEKD
jgi:hypothetical protein|nr:MAG TPA: hypothetical protein [Caudoviricetes sp.]